MVKEDVDEVILGNVLSAGIGQAPARQAAIYANLSKTVECLTINKMCGSGLKATMLADQAIKSGDAGIIMWWHGKYVQCTIFFAWSKSRL